MNFHAGVLFAKASHQDTHLCDILFDEPASLSKLACEMEKTQWSAFPVGQPE